jgi:hypothetical protein
VGKALPRKFEDEKYQCPFPRHEQRTPKKDRVKGKIRHPPARRSASRGGRDGGSRYPCATADAPRKLRPPPKGESFGRRAGALLDINMLVLALLFVSALAWPCVSISELKMSTKLKMHFKPSVQTYCHLLRLAVPCRRSSSYSEHPSLIWILLATYDIVGHLQYRRSVTTTS